MLLYVLSMNNNETLSLEGRQKSTDFEGEKLRKMMSGVESVVVENERRTKETTTQSDESIKSRRETATLG